MSPSSEDLSDANPHHVLSDPRRISRSSTSTRTQIRDRTRLTCLCAPAAPNLVPGFFYIVSHPGSRVISSPTQRLRSPVLHLSVHASTEIRSLSYEYKVQAPCTTPCTLQSAITMSAGRTTRQAPARTQNSHLTTRRPSLPPPPVSSNARPLKQRPAS